MNRKLTTIFLALLFALPAYGYDLPEVIGVVTAGHHYMTDFCCVGDANQDDKDDLLIRNYNNYLELICSSEMNRWRTRSI